MKIPDSELKQKIITGLSELPVYYPNRTHTQHVIRCDQCGDSHNLSHAHLSIHIDINDDLPMFYRCFRCNDSGILNVTKLIDLGISIDDDEASSLKIYGKKSQKKYKSKFSDKFESFFSPEISPTIQNEIKVAYINQRLGTSFSMEDVRRLKIVTSICEFGTTNYLTPKKLHLKDIFINELESNFVGFLATNNNRIMFRNIKPKLNDTDYRWFNVILNDGNMNPYTFYSIPNQIDLYYTHDVEVHIAEGIFDILSVYHNLKKEKTENTFYYASCGSSALNVISFLIDSGINTGLHIHIYADKDKSDYFHKKYLLKDSEVYQWCKSITIHRNAYPGEKDYGVPADHIIDTYHKIYTKK